MEVGKARKKVSKFTAEQTKQIQSETINNEPLFCSFYTPEIW